MGHVAVPEHPVGNTQTLAANIQLDGTTISANVPVIITNAVPGSFPSPIANNGLLPIFNKTTFPFTVAAFGDGPSGSLADQGSCEPGALLEPGHAHVSGRRLPAGHAGRVHELLQPAVRIGCRERTISTVGNHEYKQLTDGSGYFWYWNFPNGSPTEPVGGQHGGGTGGGSWYSLECRGPVRERLAHHQPEQQRADDDQPAHSAGPVAATGPRSGPRRPAEEHASVLAGVLARARGSRTSASDCPRRRRSGTSSTPTATT